MNQYQDEANDNDYDNKEAKIEAVAQKMRASPLVNIRSRLSFTNQSSERSKKSKTGLHLKLLQSISLTKDIGLK